LTLKGWAAFLGKLFSGSFKKASKKDMQALKNCLEEQK
jgi:hypothetical protein